MKKTQKNLITVVFAFVVLVIAFGIYIYSKKTDKLAACDYKYQEAEFFFATTTNYLLIDSGTAPDPRGLSFYDLNKCEKVLSVRYSRPVDITNDTVTYWEPVDIKPTSTNCPDISLWKKQGLGAGIESCVTVDLKDLSKKSLNQVRCVARQ